MLNQQGRMCNVVVALRHRSTRLGSWNTDGDLLHQHGEMLAATQCEDNCKVDLPQQSKSTFMTAFSPNCELIASCHGDHNVYVTNIVTGKVVTSLVGHERSPWCISFHPTSNEILATGCLNGEVRVWDLRGGGSESWTNQSSDHVTITSISFHPIDHFLLIASGNGIYFWDWKFPKPFASIKTSSSFELVRLARFEALGSRILTGIVNNEEESVNRDTEEEDDGLFVGLLPPPRNRNDLWELLPASSRQASRTSPSRPLTAPFNLRGRHARVTPSNEASSSNEPTARASLRQRVNDVSHAHTYSRDHRRILRARVSVQAEIQHQYNRLQQLQRERRRLEDRLRQLQTDRASLRAGGAARENRGLHNDLYALEQEVFNDYHEINEALSNRIRSRMSQVRNAALEVSQIPPPADSRSHIPPPADPLFHIPPPADPQSQNPPPTSPQPSSASWWAQARSASNPPRAVVANALDPAVILFGAPRSPSITMDTAIRPPNEPGIPTAIRPPNEPGIPRRIRRSAASRRSFARRRSYFSHVWPVPESPHSHDRLSYRLQWWDFSQLEMPEISRSDVSVVVRHCKIHNDSSVDVSKDAGMVAALIWLDGSPHAAEVGVFSLLRSSLGCLLYRYSVDASQYAICLSISPRSNYLAVGLKYFNYSAGPVQRRQVAQVLKLSDLADVENCFPVYAVRHPIREFFPHRPPSINTISWLPHVGWGLVYGTNDGQLRLCFTHPTSAEAIE